MDLKKHLRLSTSTGKKVRDDMDYKAFYESNEDFHQHVDKYCTKHEIDVDTALAHKLIQSVADYYREEAERICQN